MRFLIFIIPFIAGAATLTWVKSKFFPEFIPLARLRLILLLIALGLTLLAVFALTFNRSFAILMFACLTYVVGLLFGTLIKSEV